MRGCYCGCVEGVEGYMVWCVVIYIVISIGGVNDICLSYLIGVVD